MYECLLSGRHGIYTYSLCSVSLIPQGLSLGTSHELSSFHYEKIIFPGVNSKWSGWQVKFRGKTETKTKTKQFESLEKKLLYPAPWIGIYFALQNTREKNRRRVQGVMMTSSEVYWSSQTEGRMGGVPYSPTRPHPSLLLPQCKEYAWHLVCSVYIYMVEEWSPLSCMLERFLKDPKPLLRCHKPFRRGREGGRDWQGIG